MTSFRQIEANRRNAGKSTRPTTEEGKQRSRCNAVRHGLTAETVIGALEDAEDYKAFEETITAEYNAQSAAKRELVLRLGSLLWRLRRATTMETGLFEIQADICVSSGSPSNFIQINASSSMRCSARPTPSVSARVKHCATSLILHVAFCVSRICRATRSIGSAGMKQHFGAKPGKSCLRSTCWIDASHRIESAILESGAGKNLRSTNARSKAETCVKLRYISRVLEAS
jgi:hypothetical protein